MASHPSDCRDRRDLRLFEGLSVSRSERRTKPPCLDERSLPCALLSLDVRNMPASVDFYRKVFGRIAPQKQMAEYADSIRPSRR